MWVCFNQLLPPLKCGYRWLTGVTIMKLSVYCETEGADEVVRH